MRWLLTRYRMWRFDREATKRYEHMIGADLPHEERLRRAKRNAAHLKSADPFRP